ncbi:hypothetical protein BDV06DRAFT_218284 [Aspergillus oleicola]
MTYLQSSTPKPEPETLDLYLAITSRKTEPEHWVLILRAPGSSTCTWYHMAGGCPPSTYTHAINENKVFAHRALPVREYICSIPATSGEVVCAVARSVRPQHCQVWVLSVLRVLETYTVTGAGGGLVLRGTAERFQGLVQPNLFEGPIRRISEGEWLGLVSVLGEKGAMKALMRIQGWVGFPF